MFSWVYYYFVCLPKSWAAFRNAWYRIDSRKHVGAIFLNLARWASLSWRYIYRKCLMFQSSFYFLLRFRILKSYNLSLMPLHVCSTFLNICKDRYHFSIIKSLKNVTNPVVSLAVWRLLKGSDQWKMKGVEKLASVWRFYRTMVIDVCLFFYAAVFFSATYFRFLFVKLN